MSTDEIFKKYRILKFEKLMCLEQLKIGYKLCNNLLPTNFTAQIRHDHKGQSTSNIAITQETSMYQIFLLYRTANINPVSCSVLSGNTVL